MICVICPKGCDMKVETEGSSVNVYGNACKRGYDYAVTEMTDPRRTLTTTVRVELDSPHGSIKKIAPVKSAKPLPKGLLLQAVKEINKVILSAPGKEGDIVLRDILDTGIDIVLTDNVLPY